MDQMKELLDYLRTDRTMQFYYQYDPLVNRYIERMEAFPREIPELLLGLLTHLLKDRDELRKNLYELNERYNQPIMKFARGAYVENSNTSGRKEG